jgi:hypothetical protein
MLRLALEVITVVAVRELTEHAHSFGTVGDDDEMITEASERDDGERDSELQQRGEEVACEGGDEEQALPVLVLSPLSMICVIA